MGVISTLTLFVLAMVWPVTKYIKHRRNKKRNNDDKLRQQATPGHYEGHWD